MSLSKGSIEKLLREVVGEDVQILHETIDWLNECARELLQVIGKEANTIAEIAAKNENYRISQEHVTKALENLGMRRYVDEIQRIQGSSELKMQKKKERVSRKKIAAESASRDELLAEQMALFEQALLKANREGW
ncbi:transcription corepressor [Plasmopara halstedii]|uniref:Transcription corepressor n=1 Tax=Plasmopara halstedii TaxID=4781 RepID=A0A0P1APK0_PLAHL|nr:transcription corepressor [Plasmopara halstedii]CEG43405.1 transcription corepressor [Plasmopara halstedii]|eukprot:XP_024579774.1 transcription corepressor [Plasmopara halstedii]